MPPVNPDHLIEQARSVSKPTQGRPRDTDLRRSISTAYYALFHAITEAMACHCLGAGSAGEAAFNRLRRGISHAAIAEVCDIVSTAKGTNYGGFSPHLANAAKKEPTIRNVAAVFLDLYDARQTADYDHQATMLTQAVVLSTITRAETAVQQLREACAGTTSSAAAAFCTMLGAKAN